MDTDELEMRTPTQPKITQWHAHADARSNVEPCRRRARGIVRTEAHLPTEMRPEPSNDAHASEERRPERDGRTIQANAERRTDIHGCTPDARRWRRRWRRWQW